VTGIVLTLAGLTCCDGGQSAGAARAPVEMTRRDGFGCYLRGPGLQLIDIELSKGKLSFRWPGRGLTNGPASLTLDGEGRFRLTFAGATLKGTVISQGPRMFLNVKPPLPHSVNEETQILWDNLRAISRMTPSR
jgi:hypothetical protein